MESRIPQKMGTNMKLGAVDKMKLENIVRPPLHRKAKENVVAPVNAKRKAEQAAIICNKPAKKRSAFGDITNAIGKTLNGGKKNLTLQTKAKVKLPPCVLGLAKPIYPMAAPTKIFDPEHEAANFTTIEDLEKKMNLNFSFDEKVYNMTAAQRKIHKKEAKAKLKREFESYTKPAEKNLPENVPDFEKESMHDLYSVPEYAFDIFTYYKKRELKFNSQKYLDVQTDINRKMRAILVDWIVEVQESFELNHETMYLAVKLVDLYLSKVIVTRQSLQLVGSAAMFIACKFDERSPPLVDDFLYICDDAYERKELLEMEMKILKALEYDLGIPLSYRFLRRYGRCARLTMDKLTFARYILEYSQMEYDFIDKLESLKAASALCLALHISKEPCWNPTLQFYSGYTLDELRSCVAEMHKLLLQPKSSQLKTIVSKYSHSVFFKVAETVIPDNIELDLQASEN